MVWRSAKSDTSTAAFLLAPHRADLDEAALVLCRRNLNHAPSPAFRFFVDSGFVGGHCEGDTTPAPCVRTEPRKITERKRFNTPMNQPRRNPSLLSGTICGYAVALVAGAVALIAVALMSRPASMGAGFLLLAGLGAIGVASGYHATMQHRQALGLIAPRNLRSRLVRAMTVLGLNLLVIPVSLGAALLLAVLIKAVLGLGIG
jgi:hypothetical protein